MIQGWQNIAFNQAPDSANEIHGDRVARQYGFRGGLVPGVTISAYLLHPAVEAWGLDFLNDGNAIVRVGSPLYDEEDFEVKICEHSERGYRAEICGPDGKVSASAEVSLPENVEAAPKRRGDRLMSKDFGAAPATQALFETLRQQGCLACRYHWGSEHNMQTYVRDIEAMPELHRSVEDGYANMGFLLGCSNWVLASNAHMNPWVHLETRSQNYRAVAKDTAIIAELSVKEYYEKKGHEFVDVDVHLFDETDDTCVATIALRAIYKLRGL